MKRFSTRSKGSPARRPERGRWGPLCAALLLGVTGGGCVGAGTYRDVVRERDAFAARTRALDTRSSHLDTANESLQQERADLMEKLEDLRIERDELSAGLAEAREREARLSADLSDRQRALVGYRKKLTEAKEEVSRLSETYTTLVSDLESEVSAGQIEIEQLREGLRVNVSNDILFASGSAKLDPIGRQVLGKLVKKLASMSHAIEVQGYTDDRPIHGRLAKLYPSNWELAAARAARVVRLMEEKGIASDRLSVVSYASERPVAPNDTPENRVLNRRIEIRVYPRQAVDAKPLRSTSTPGDSEKAKKAETARHATTPAKAPKATKSGEGSAKKK